ncbi:MAG: ribosomal protein S18-alanine N-acetyltransferase [Desulfatiglandaceae bacterium]
MTDLSLQIITMDNFPLFRKRLIYIERFSFVSPWPVNSFKNELLNPISRIWGALDGEVFVGFTCFWIVVGNIHLLNIAVAPEKRGMGIGKYLLGRVIELGENTSVDRIWLEVRPSNSAALALYRGAGFIKDGIRPGYYNDTGEDAVLMSLYLNSAGGYRESLNRPDALSLHA